MGLSFKSMHMHPILDNCKQRHLHLHMRQKRGSFLGADTCPNLNCSMEPWKRTFRLTVSHFSHRFAKVSREYDGILFAGLAGLASPGDSAMSKTDHNTNLGLAQNGLLLQSRYKSAFNKCKSTCVLGRPCTPSSGLTMR